MKIFDNTNNLKVILNRKIVKDSFVKFDKIKLENIKKNKNNILKINKILKTNKTMLSNFKNYHIKEKKKFNLSFNDYVKSNWDNQTKFKIKHINVARKKKHNFTKFLTVLKKSHIFNVIKIKININFNIINDIYINPDSRQFPLLIMDKTLLYLYGGLSYDSLNDLWIYDIQNKIWKRIYLKNKLFDGIYNHFGFFYKKQLYIYTLKTKNNNKHYYNNLYKIDLKERIIYHIPLYFLVPVRKRYYDCICSLKHYIFIFGGVDMNQNIFKSYNLINIKQNNINTYNITNFPFKNGILNSACIYFMKNYSVKSKKKDYINNDGIYIFGGHDINGKLIKNLYFLEMKKNASLVIADLEGRPPTPRYKHSMFILKNLNYIIIVGGINININDYIYGINIDSKHYFNIDWKGDFNRIKNIENYGFTYNNNSIYIFGGLQDNEFIKNNLIKFNIL